MSDDQSKKSSRAEEPATEAIPKQQPGPVGPRRIEPRIEPGTGRADTTRQAVTQAKPQRIGAHPEPQRTRRRGGRWIAALATALVVIAAVGIAGFVYLSREGAGTSAENRIRESIGGFTQALTTGDLGTLRTSSCGDLATFYRDIPDTEFADVHRVAVEQGNIPVVENIDAVQITGDTAIAQVIAYTAANPNDRSPRTFDLRLDEDEWKVCSPA
ncbi:Rv0361 family membrane protein [Rhodococcoides yunnanense]|uniref:Rv0361 family membrane protein n=1 Tax=Rhodococcoides yunnanense TaxID=278209 RepID=UPI000AB98DB3|nr:hypothetical protein [Rhodococcus yunnanensis]